MGVLSRAVEDYLPRESYLKISLSLSLSLSFSAKNYLINHRPYTLLNLFLPMVLSPLNSFSYSLLDNTGGCFTFSEKNEF